MWLDRLGKILNWTSNIRASYRIVSSLEKKAIAANESIWKLSAISNFKYFLTVSHWKRANIEEKQKALCLEVIELLEAHLLPKSSGESCVFFSKMRGDYYRYLSEIYPDKYRQKALDAYDEANKVTDRGSSIQIQYS